MAARHHFSLFLMQKSQVLHHAWNGGKLGLAVMQKSDAPPIADVTA
ncbi:hypothetical protein [Sphingomonas sp. 10B4]|nr:hypothetical protein [Sphingomonas sp. 10B4]MDY7526263.1 hypothetical protein [Sphingomonas sp. 10B4]MEB0284492.1 hypothetical protein [Sphingomonas sp. 10B4]